ncbi:MAG: malto-oligosyltrehalose synthase [Shinella sp.]|nr:malto-oligosyltrehalose synthase [Shinella sp.]
MSNPTATYRLQFRNGMDFNGAIDLIPHLSSLHVSHLYASPVFTATRGSTHGYDIVDANEIDPALGGREGFERMVAALRAAGLRLILDIVPNHMAASLENPWWRSIVEWGDDSRCAHHFDIDWSQRLTLPFLGESFEAELSKGKLRLAYDKGSHCLALGYYDTLYPLAPATYHEALKGLKDRDVAEELATAAETASARRAEDFHAEIALILANRAKLAAFEEDLAVLSRDPALIGSLHALQPWQLMDWKQAAAHLSYRRFFEIAGLVGLRIEDRRVFADTHRLVLELVRAGLVDGLRVDHVDGLADPASYLERLRRETGEETFIVVEKILEQEEILPAWPVAGTTGYEFISALSALLSDEREDGRLDRAFRSLSDHPRSIEEERRACKHLMLTQNFAGEVERLTALAGEIAQEAGSTLPAEALAAAIRALILELSVYRTYATADGADENDRRLLDDIAERACRHMENEAERHAASFIRDVMKSNEADVDITRLARFRARFQQLSGPVMAKAVEDTLFYRNTAFLAANEVGGDPGRAPGGPQRFHRMLETRAAAMPAGLSATSTHDTKRGEDARARLYVLSEIPEQWATAVGRWRRMNAHLVGMLPDGAAPEPQVEWMIYQSLAGVWPIKGLENRTLYESLSERMSGFVVKALREAKLRSNWSQPNNAYEDAAKAYVAGLLDPENTRFINDFGNFVEPLSKAGLVNSLSQTLVKLAAPGIPDIYRGAEQLDFSLVDPDNRRPFAPEVFAETAFPARPTVENIAGYKQWLVGICLALRENPTADFFNGDYSPLATTGENARHVAAFMRRGRTSLAVTVVPRLAFAKIRKDWLGLSEEWLSGVQIRLPASCTGVALRDAISGRTFEAAPTLDAGLLLERHPVAFLVSE